jgi:hypothetical protein
MVTIPHCLLKRNHPRRVPSTTPRGVRPRQHHAAERPAQHVLELPQQLAAHQPLSNWLKAQQHTLTWHPCQAIHHTAGAPFARGATHATGLAARTPAAFLLVGVHRTFLLSPRRSSQKVCQAKCLMLLYLLLRVEFWGSAGEAASLFTCSDGRRFVPSITSARSRAHCSGLIGVSADDVLAQHVLELLRVTPVLWVTIFQPENGSSRVRRHVLDIRRVDRLLAAGRHEDLDGLVVIADGSAVERPANATSDGARYWIFRDAPAEQGGGWWLPAWVRHELRRNSRSPRTFRFCAAYRRPKNCSRRQRSLASRRWV